MRLLIDLQGAQGDNRARGIGRYSRELARAMAAAPRGHDITIALNANLETAPLQAAFAGVAETRLWHAPSGTAASRHVKSLSLGNPAGRAVNNHCPFILDHHPSPSMYYHPQIMAPEDEIEVLYRDGDLLHFRHNWLPNSFIPIILLLSPRRFLPLLPLACILAFLSRNYTEIGCTEISIAWHHRPLPWIPARSLAASAISAFVLHHSPSRHHGLSLRLLDGSDILLLTGIHDPAEVNTAARRLSLHFSIPVLPASAP